MLALAMCRIESRERASRSNKGSECYRFAENNNLKAGLKNFGKKSKDGARKEVKKLSSTTARKPTHPIDITKDEKRKAMESLFFFLGKRDGAMKGRECANGSMQRSHDPKE